MTSVHFLVMLFKDTKNSGTLTWCFVIINKPLILCLAPLPDNPILYKSILSITCESVHHKKCYPVRCNFSII